MSESYKSIPGLYEMPAAAPASEAAASGIVNCSMCTRPFASVGGQGHLIRDRWVCDPCLQAAKAKAAKAEAGGIGAVASDDAFLASLIFGAGAAVLGLALYAGFTIVTHLYLGWIAFGVGWMIAKAMMIGSKEVGGTKYQIAAVVLTYLAIALAAIPITIEFANQAAQGRQIDWMAHAGQLAFYGLFSPFLRLSAGISHIIGLVILFAGLRVAWRVAAGKQ